MNAGNAGNNENNENNGNNGNNGNKGNARFAARLTMAYPASWWGNMWREALPTGNGKIGASVFGGVREETVLLGHARLWHWGRKDPLPDVGGQLAETRRRMDEKRYLEASWTLADALRDAGYATKPASRFPLGALRLSMPCDFPFRRYSRSLEMETGEVTVSWEDGPAHYRRRLFVSRADDLVVLEIASDREGGFSGSAGLGLHPSDRMKDAPEYRELERSATTSADGDCLCYAARNDDGTDFGAVLRAFPAEAAGADVSEAGVRFAGTRRLLLLVKLFAEGERARDWERLKRELAALDAPDYESLLERHARRHGPLIRSASLELGDADADGRTNEELLLEAYRGEASETLANKLWAYGRYLFACGTAPDSEPFGLYGLWGGDYRLVWSHNMANENVQMMYWHAETGNMGELVPSLFRYYDGLMDDFRENARKLYGCRGVWIPAGTTPGNGSPSQIVPVILNWTGAAGWLARHYFEHYRYTGDLAFLADTALPFMREAVRFYEDFLVAGEDGRCRVYPSVSPENTPQNFMPADGRALAHPMPTAIDATMDVAILRELLANAAEANRLVGGDPAETRRWEEMRDRLPPYAANEDGAAREWLHPDFDDRYEHRHLSHLYPVFPGSEVTEESDPALYRAFETAVRKRDLGAQSGWSLAHMASIYARLGDGDAALGCLDALARSCLLPNLFTLHNDWRGMGICMTMDAAPVQLDANLGWTNAVQEMLLQETPNQQLLKLLPALPSRWRKGRLARWRFSAGRVAIEWDRKRGTFRAEAVAERPTRVVIKLPAWPETYSFYGEGCSWGPSDLGGAYLAVELKRGGRLVVEGSDGEPA